jgi:hypothetical protein
MLDYGAALAGLLAWGAHAVVPWRLAGGPPRARRLWGLAALPLLGAGALAGLALAAARTDAVLGAGWGVRPLTRGVVHALVVLVPALAATDLLLAVARHRLEPAGWRVAAGVGGAALAVAALAAELLRAGGGPATGIPGIVAAAGCRAVLALAAGEALTPSRPLAAAAAALAIPVYWLSLPAPVGDLLAAEGSGWTAAAAATLLAAARWLPRRLRRPGLAAGVLLAALLLARAGIRSATYPLTPPPPVALGTPR